MNNDQIEQFKQFMEFIQNVDKYQKLIEDLQVATSEYDEAVSALRQGQTIVAMQEKLTQAQEKFKQDVQDTNDGMVSLQLAREQKLSDQASTLGQREAQLMQKERSLNERENVVRQLEVGAQQAVESMSQQQAKLDAQENDLKQREDVLTSKASQIQQLLG